MQLEFLTRLGQNELSVRIEAQRQGDDLGEFYCWSKGKADPEPVATCVAPDACAASEQFIEGIRASSPWPRWVSQGDAYRAPGAIPEIRVCIDASGREYLVGEVDWLPSEEMSHGELWSWFGCEEKEAFTALWAAMKRGPNDDWF